MNHAFCALAGACDAAIWGFTGALTVSALAGSTPTPVNIFVASISFGLNLACSEKASATEVWAIGIGLAGALSDRSTGGADGNQRAATCALGCGVIVATGAGSGIGASDADCTELVWMVMVFTNREEVRSPPRDNGKVLFSITVVAGADIGASAGGSGDSQRAAT